MREQTAASYDGNMGFQEMMKFYQIATKPQTDRLEELLEKNKFNAAWQLLQDVTHMPLKPLKTQSRLAAAVSRRYLDKIAAPVLTSDNVIKTLRKAGIYLDLWKTDPDPKDRTRIQDIVVKGQTADKMLALVLKMARSITDSTKAVRRGQAAHDFPDTTMRETASQIFFSRALELAGLGRMITPAIAVAPAPKKQFDAPAVPSSLIPKDADEWQMYSDTPGANTAAKGLSKVLLGALEMTGRNVTPLQTDSANAKALTSIIQRMDKARYNRDDFGAGDTEPRGVMLTRFERYLKLYMDRYDFPKTFAVLGGW